MALDRITLSHFRNHSESRLDGTGHFNLLIGENGAGKTNVLEALSLFAPGRGLRRAALVDIPQKQGGDAPPTGFATSARLDNGASATSAVSVSMSSGSDTTTGPGRPCMATRKARAISSGMRAASSISTTHLAIEPNTAL